MAGYTKTGARAVVKGGDKAWGWTKRTTKRGAKAIFGKHHKKK
jgi:hypothetical protein